MMLLEMLVRIVVSMISEMRSHYLIQRQCHLALKAMHTEAHLCVAHSCIPILVTIPFQMKMITSIVPKRKVTKQWKRMIGALI